jgi:hypothetical protein
MDMDMIYDLWVLSMYVDDTLISVVCEICMICVSPPSPLSMPGLVVCLRCRLMPFCWDEF